MFSIKGLHSARVQFRVVAVLMIGYLAQTSVSAGAIVQPPSGTPASSVTFDFNSLSATATHTEIQTNLNDRLAAAGYQGTVTVTGAVGANGYAGEGFVVNSLTLGTVNGGNFIINNNGVVGNTDPSSDRITLLFSRPIFGLRFDLEIFPDGSGIIPDFTFNAYVNQADVNPIAQQTFFGEVPPIGAHSPNNTGVNFETNRQLLLIGSPLTSFSFPTGITKVEFIDWPPTIGIDNLTLQLDPLSTIASVPEPGTLLLLACALGSTGVGAFLRRKSRRAS